MEVHTFIVRSREDMFFSGLAGLEPDDEGEGMGATFFQCQISQV
jgi:hypothetical protein